MAARRLLVATTDNDALSDENIRTVLRASTVSLWAGCVTLTDTIALFLDSTEIIAAGIMNIRAAAISFIDISADGLLFDHIIGPGQLRVPVVVTTSLIFHIIVEPLS